MEPAFIVLLISLGIASALLLFLFIYLARQKKVRRDTQRDCSDRDILQLIATKIDGFITAKELAGETNLTESEAKTRLMALGYTGILRTSMTGMATYHFELTRPIEEVEIPVLSTEPFLTADDILQLFEAFEYRLDYQDLIIGTGLPLGVLEREMKYFVKEKMVVPMRKSMGYGARPYQFYLLAEPYRSDPQKFSQRGEKVDMKLKELLSNDQLI